MFWFEVVSQEVGGNGYWITGDVLVWSGILGGGGKGYWRCTGLEWYLGRWGERVTGDVLVWSGILGGGEKGLLEMYWFGVVSWEVGEKGSWRCTGLE